MKRFGNEKTGLVLTEKASLVYSASDPLEIVETENGLFDIHGLEERAGLTSEQVNNLLECYYNEDPAAYTETETETEETEAAKEIIKSGLFNQAVELMDNDIREEIHLNGQAETELEFLTIYLEKHKAKYNENFTI